MSADSGYLGLTLSFEIRFKSSNRLGDNAVRNLKKKCLKIWVQEVTNWFSTPSLTLGVKHVWLCRLETQVYSGAGMTSAGLISAPCWSDDCKTSILFTLYWTPGPYSTVTMRPPWCHTNTPALGAGQFVIIVNTFHPSDS